MWEKFYCFPLRKKWILNNTKRITFESGTHAKCWLFAGAVVVTMTWHRWPELCSVGQFIGFLLR